MQVALGIVLHCEKSLLEMADMEEMVDFLKSEVGPASPACSIGSCASHVASFFAMGSRAMHHHVACSKRADTASMLAPAGPLLAT